MRVVGTALVAVAAVALGWVAVGSFGQAPAPSAPPPAPAGPTNIFGTALPADPVFNLQDSFLRWPLPAGAEAYGAIDGKHLHQYVEALAAISRRYRDQHHPQLWGRLTGTSSDTETARLLMDKFKQLGLTDVREVVHDLPPQWFPDPWQITATLGGKTLQLDRSAQPAYGTEGTASAGLDLEAMYLGTGSEADFRGRDVKGKAVFMFSMPLPGSMRRTLQVEGGIRRAFDNGAAAIFDIVALPGNMRNQLYPQRGVTVPVFAIGMEDGYAVRDLIGQAPAGQAPRVKITLPVKMVPDMKTRTVFATLPGATDETVYVMAHYDGWFEAATDNASGVATQIGLAEYFAKIPTAQRRRTLIFIGLSGHHNNVNKSVEYLIANRERLFAKSALVINSEHTSTIQTYFYGENIRWANTYTAQLWYAGGPSRPKLQDITVKAFREFGVPMFAEPERGAPPTDFTSGQFWRYVPALTSADFNMYFHTDRENPDTVPWTGLEATTRAYARIIDEVNTLDLKEFQRPPEEPLPTPTAAPPSTRPAPAQNR